MILAYYKKKKFYFRIPFKTSNNFLYSRLSWFIKIIDQKKKYFGIGECAPLKSFSKENFFNYEQKIKWLCNNINKEKNFLYKELRFYPSIIFGLEQAFLSFKKNNLIFFSSDFTLGIKGIPINGLILMGSIDFMKYQVRKKVKQGFSCLKIKIGLHSFEEEYKFIANIREEYPDIEIRLDANGSFPSKGIIKKFERLSSFKIHSIEQPILPGQRKIMNQLCKETPIPIVLDEELIYCGFNYKDKKKLLEEINPHYFVLKLSLCGGFQSANDWINIAKKKNISWWITSSLESNIGLNAIAQWTYLLNNPIFHGLETNCLFTKNISSPLKIKNQYLWYCSNKSWNLNFFK